MRKLWPWHGRTDETHCGRDDGGMRLIGRIGIAVSPREIHAMVFTRGRGIIRRAAVRIDVEGMDGIERAVTEVLHQLPCPRRPPWLPVRIYAAVDDTWANVKTVRGLPEVDEPRTLQQVIAAAPNRFFVVREGAVVVTGVRVVEPGVARVAVLSRTLVDAVYQGCVRSGASILALTPAAVALEALSEVERTDPLAAARGAAVLSRREPLVYRPKQRQVRGARRRRFLVAGALGGLIACCTAVIPTVTAMRSEGVARRTIGTLAHARAAALMTKRDLDVVALSLAAVADFEQSRQSVTLLLSQLTGALPPGSAITLLRSDTSGLTLGLLAPHAADAVKAISNMAGVTRVELVGPVIREGTTTTGGAPEHAIKLERVTVHCQRLSDPTSARRLPSRGIATVNPKQPGD